MQELVIRRVTLAAALALSGLGWSAGAALAVEAVGALPASSGVTANGAPVYAIPIEATPGIGGMTPRLAISYAGPGQRTILGVGFQLAGLSYITPCRKTIAQDLNAAPVLLQPGDRFCLDGARLRSVSGTYGGSGSTYRTELDQLARVTSNESSNNIPGWFKVETRDGLIYEYGRTADSKLLAGTGGSGPPMFWAVNKIYDRSGNAIIFVYENVAATRTFRPSYIRYTDSYVGTGHYRLDFVYQDPPATGTVLTYESSASGGASQVETKVLGRIELKHDSNVYRQYLFTYQTGAGSNARLTAIQQCAVTSGDCFPATTFDWRTATAGHGSAAASNAVAGQVIPLDLNGDGFDDLVWASSGTWRYMLGSSSGYGTAYNTSIAATNPSKALPLDWDGDGRMDLLVDWSDGKWRVLTGTSTGLASPVHAGPGSGIPSNTAHSSWWVADANGDGRDDLLRAYTNNDLVVYLRLNGTGGFGSETAAYDDVDLRANGNPFVGLTTYVQSTVRQPDFNGDGRDDLLLYACLWDSELGRCLFSYWYQLLSNGTSYTNQGNVSGSVYNIAPRLGDFNADGLTDVVYAGKNPNSWCFAFAQGGGGMVRTCGPSITGYTYLSMTADYDGDGYDDLYAYKSSTNLWEVYRGTGNGMASTPIATGISLNGTAGWLVSDADGNGLPDLGYYLTTGGYWQTRAHAGTPGEQLNWATDGFGNKVVFNYLPMSNATVYQRGSGATYPMQDYQSAASLVHTMEVQPAGGTNYIVTYWYANARRDSQGRAFLGMGTRTVTDNRGNSVKTTETYQQNFPYIGAVATTTIKQPNDTVIQEVTHSYAYHELDGTSGNQRYLPYRSQSLIDTYEVGGSRNGAWITRVTDSRTVNTLGNTTAAAVTTVDQDSGSSEYLQTYTTAVTATYSEDQGNWCLALPTTRTETRTPAGQSPETRSAEWVVAGAQCRVSQETIEPNQGSSLSLVTDVGYDSCGNVNSTSSYPAGQSSLARPTTTNYGTRCQLPETVTNPLGQSTTLLYDYALGVMTSRTDPNGIETGFEYDGFGRLTSQLNPDGTETRVALTKCDASNSYCGKTSGIKFKVTQTAHNTLDAVLRTDETFLDGLGRPRFAHQDTLESGPAIVEMQYDAYGRVSQRSQPRLGAGATYWTTFSYDLLGRMTQQNAPISEGQSTGRTTLVAYEGRDVRITDPRLNTTTRTQNVIGQLKAVVDPSPGGTTSYGYKPFGELASITDAASNTSSWTYNLRGFVTQTVDPDAGTWDYVPNAFGELTSQTNAKRQQVTFTYDKLSRPLTRVEPEGTTTWTWGSSPGSYNIGRLASIASPGSYSESYSYDNKGRPSQQAVTADGTTYYVNQTYDPYTGLPATLEYPTSTSGYRLKLGYDYASNLLKRVRDANGSTVFWEVTSTDAWGHIQDETFGNGVATFTDFDQANGWMEARQGGIGGGTGLINATTSWDLNGNLTQRQDLKQSVTESFYYDSLNRFDYSQRNGSTNQDVKLDAIGNIQWKKDVCPTGADCYTYHATKRRAVINAGSNNYGYDANGNMNSRLGSSIIYTSYDLPTGINAPGGYSSTIAYGAFRNRYKQIAVSASGTETTIYVGGILEKVTRSGVTEYRHLIHGGKGVAAIYTRRTSGSPLTDTFYVHADHLGSPELITNAAGADVVKLSFGAYGERRDRDWDGAVSSGDMTTIGNTIRHGFTGHEHLDSVGLVHMNGRVYDPVVGRFLSVDPIVQVGISQSPNSYGYVWNNPLSLVDPIGWNPDCPNPDTCSSDTNPIIDIWFPSLPRWWYQSGPIARAWLNEIESKVFELFRSGALGEDAKQWHISASRCVNFQERCSEPQGTAVFAVGPRAGTDGAIARAAARDLSVAAGSATGAVLFVDFLSESYGRTAPYTWPILDPELMGQIRSSGRVVGGIIGTVGTMIGMYAVADDIYSSRWSDAAFGSVDLIATGAMVAGNPLAGYSVAGAYSAAGGSRAIVRTYISPFQIFYRDVQGRIAHLWLEGLEVRQGRR